MAPLLGQDPPGYDADWLQLQMNEEDDNGVMMNTATTSQPQPKDTSFGSSGWDCGWEPCWEEAFPDTENLFSCSAAENVFSGGGACGGTNNIGGTDSSPSPRTNPFDENIATASKNSAINNNNNNTEEGGRSIVVEPVALQVATDIDSRSVTNKSVISSKSFEAQQQQQQQQVAPAPPVSQVSFDKETNETQSIARSQITTANYSAAPRKSTFYDNDDEDTAATEPTHNCSPCSYTKGMYSMLRELKIACGKCDRECHNIMVSGTYQCCNILDTLCSDAFWIPGGTSGTKKNF